MNDTKALFAVDCGEVKQIGINEFVARVENDREGTEIIYVLADDEARALAVADEFDKGNAEIGNYNYMGQTIGVFCDDDVMEAGE